MGVREVFKGCHTVDHNGGSHWGVLLEGCVHGRFRCSHRSITTSWGEEFLLDRPGGGGGTRRLNCFALSGGGTPYPQETVFREAWFEGTLPGMEG